MVLTEVVRDEICKRYVKGQNTYELARAFNVCHETIRKVLRKRGVPLRSRTEAGRKYQIDKTYFRKIDTEEKAYCFGYFIAEGNIIVQRKQSKTLQITASTEEKEHLQKLVNFFSDYRVHIRKSGTRQAARVFIISNEFVEALFENGFYSCTNSVTLPKIQDKQLYKHLIRGYWDGDGTLYRRKDGTWTIAFVGDFSLLNWIKEFLAENCGTSLTKALVKIPNAMNTYALRYDGNSQAFRIAQWLYSNAHIFFERRWKRYLEMVADLNQRNLGPFKT